MSDQGVVIAFKPSSGRMALRTDDGSFVLAEQTDANPLREGLSLHGNMHAFGPETWSDEGEQARYEVFVLAWDLSQEAVDTEML